MINQFEAEKCLHAPSTDNLRLMIIENSPDPQATLGQPLGNSDGTDPGTRTASRCLELTDALWGSSSSKKLNGHQAFEYMSIL